MPASTSGSTTGTTVDVGDGASVVVAAEADVVGGVKATVVATVVGAASVDATDDVVGVVVPDVGGAVALDAHEAVSSTRATRQRRVPGNCCDLTFDSPPGHGTAAGFIQSGQSIFGQTSRTCRQRRLLGMTTLVGVRTASGRPRSVGQHMPSKQPFEAIVEIHGPTVLRVCHAIVGATDADDAWSETFLSAMKAYPSLPADANVEAWLVTIAHRRAIDIGRARSRRAIPTDRVVDRAAGSEPAVLDNGFDLATALAALPDKQRQSVAYHYLAGLPYVEVAAILGGTAEAARRAAADGIAALRRIPISKSSSSRPFATERNPS